VKKIDLPKTLWWAVGSIVLMLIGAFGPWAKVLGIAAVNGTDGGKDGWIVVGAAVVAAAVIFSFVRWPRRWLLTLPILAGIAGAATAAYDINDINSLAPSSDSLFGGVDVVDAGWGIYLALVSSISLTLASIALWVETRRRAGTPEVSQTPTPAPS
jgi:xanthine/uracil permease